MVGLSLLTLVPGVVGGSETYARELTLALRRRSTFDYRPAGLQVTITARLA